MNGTWSCERPIKDQPFECEDATYTQNILAPTVGLREQLINFMMTTRNITRNVVVEEANNQPNLIEVMRNLQRQMEKMQRKYYEELRTLHAENTTMQQE